MNSTYWIVRLDGIKMAIDCFSIGIGVFAFALILIGIGCLDTPARRRHCGTRDVGKCLLMVGLAFLPALLLLVQLVNIIIPTTNEAAAIRLLSRVHSVSSVVSNDEDRKLDDIAIAWIDKHMADVHE